MGTPDVVSPDPEFESELGEWLVTCPHCLRVVFGEDPDEAMNAWTEHDVREHPTLPDTPLWGTPLLDALLDPTTPEGAWAIWAARDYWTPGRFTGGEYERLGLGPNGLDPSPNTITASDIVAVSMLGVDVPALTSLDLLDLRAGEINAALARVPLGPLHTVERAEVEHGPALELWELIRNRDQKMGRTKTSKLLARKRPHLLPVFDSRLEARLRLPVQDWAWWWDWWHNPDHVTAVEDLRRAVAADRVTAWVSNVSLLRIVDVLVWRYDAAQDARPDQGLE